MFCLSRSRFMEEANRNREAEAARELKWRKQLAKHELEDRSTREAVDAFLESCAAMPCPIEAYAAWLLAWVSQGGKITHSRDYNFNPNRRIMPTRNTTVPIPTAYGARALKLIVVSAVANIPMQPTSNDHRSGWEWGHGTVQMLKIRHKRWDASTNDTYVVESYPDVEELISSMSPLQLEERVFTLATEYRSKAGLKVLNPGSSQSLQDTVRKSKD